MMKDENKDAALSLLNKRSQMATNQQSSLSLGGKHSLNLKHQHHILSTNHSMFSTEGKQHVNNLHPCTLNCLIVESHIRQCLQDHAGNVSVWRSLVAKISKARHSPITQSTLYMYCPPVWVVWAPACVRWRESGSRPASDSTQH